MWNYFDQLIRKSLCSEDQGIRCISMLDVLFGFVAGFIVGVPLFLALLG